MASHSSLRASDADREAVAERLRNAVVEGRLEPEELEERLHAALRARTYGDLRRLHSDLPSKPKAWAGAMPVARVAFAVAMALAVVIVVLVVAAVLAAWLVLWALVWLGLWGRRACSARLGARAQTRWDRTPIESRIAPRMRI